VTKTETPHIVPLSRQAVDILRELNPLTGRGCFVFPGARSNGRPISKAGNPRLRHIMIELAWLWLRHQPGSALSGWFRARVGNERGRIRRITIVALARKLLIALWRYVTQGEVPKGAVLKAA
jgi:transposase